MANVKRKSSKYDFNDPGTIAFLTSQKHKFEQQRDQSSGEANNTERSLSGQLILLTTVLITVSVVALSNGDLLNHLSVNQKLLIILAFILETTATICGIVHYFKMENSYNKWADAYHKVTLILDAHNFNTQEELVTKISDAQSNLDIHPARPALKLQVGTIVATFAVYLLLLIAVFFNFHNSLTIFAN